MALMGFQQSGMVFLEPRDRLGAESDGQAAHRLRVGVGYEADTLVAGDVVLLLENVERVDGPDVDARVSRSDWITRSWCWSREAR